MALEIFKEKSSKMRKKWRQGGGGALFLICNIGQILNLELKIYIVFESWTEKLHFSSVANIFKTSIRGFFANSVLRS
jgi:hypothetical protein